MILLLRKSALFTLSILIVTFVCRGIIAYGFSVTLDSEFWYRDFLGNLAVALIVALLVQSRHKALILSSVIIVMFQLCNAAKISILGTPASPDDFFNIQNLFFLTDGWRQIALFFVISIPLILAVIFIPWKRASVWLSLIFLGATGFAVNAQSVPLRNALDSLIGNSVWDQPANFRDRGLALHLAQETIRTMSKVEKAPMRTDVAAAQQVLSADSAKIMETALQDVMSDTEIAPDRNVHILVLESFFDPLSLGSDWVPQDPLPEDFRRLWQQTGNATALSPVFGGYTANAEFEMLCGFPVTTNAVFFEGWLRQSAPCLPKQLSDLGYHTLASHPNVPGFWNRTNAYQYVGFEEYLSKVDFDLTDSVDTLLLDHSLYSQISDHIEKSDLPGPVFNYVLTYHGHLPYPSNDNYPDKVAAGKDAGLLHAYLNQVWYKSRDLMQHLEVLRSDDPDALIVIFGDHLPFLGPNYGVYTEAWNMPDDRSEFSGAQLEQLTSTPLIVIDGKRGPLQLGKLPLYRLPSLVMSLLGHEDPSMFDATSNPDNVTVRPVYGMHISATDESTTACMEVNVASSPCNISAPWLQQIKVLTSDIFTGSQYSLD